MTPELQALLDKARELPPMTAEQLFEQKVSWCYGMQSKSSTLTKDEVRQMILKHEGRAP